MALKVAHCIKFSIFILLFIIFINWFGLPSYERYLEKEVIMIKTVQDPKPLKAPAVVVCPDYVRIATEAAKENNLSTNILLGEDFVEYFSAQCQMVGMPPLTTPDLFYMCLDGIVGRMELLEVEQVVLGSLKHDSRTRKDENITLTWNKIVNDILFGYCFYTNDVPDMKEMETLRIYLKPQYYRVFLVDSNNIITSNNPMGFPTVENHLVVDKVEIGKNETLLQYIWMEQYELMNRDERPCTNYSSDPSLSFHSCVADKIRNIAGCRVGVSIETLIVNLKLYAA